MVFSYYDNIYIIYYIYYIKKCYKQFDFKLNILNCNLKINFNNQTKIKKITHMLKLNLILKINMNK